MIVDRLQTKAPFDVFQIKTNSVVLTIRDSGHGIDAENLPKIFEPFFTTKEAGKGTGLGVSISYSIIKDFDGIIEVNSEINKGTTFIINLKK